MKEAKRCGWAESTLLLRQYHDAEWGVPLHDDRKLFEFLILEGTQAGLNWLIILQKRAAYRKALRGFQPKKIAMFSAANVRQLLGNKAIIRNRLKLNAAVINARQFISVQEEFGSFNDYIWEFVGGKPIKHRFRTLSSIPSTSRESDLMSADLKKRGFKFVGSTICYAFMQATGMVNDHLINCYRYTEV